MNSAGPLASPDEFSLEHPGDQVWQVKPQSDPKPQPSHKEVPSNQSKFNSKLDCLRTTHRRTASDPNDSQHAVKKWIKYEKTKDKSKKVMH